MLSGSGAFGVTIVRLPIFALTSHASRQALLCFPRAAAVGKVSNEPCEEGDPFTRSNTAFQLFTRLGAQRLSRAQVAGMFNTTHATTGPTHVQV
jgi:hypothetical protein